MKSRMVVLLVALMLLAIAIIWPPATSSHVGYRPHRHKGGGKNVLVLDLDETLVHSVPYADEGSNGGGGGGGYRVILRPHVLEFLATAGRMFDEVAVFTAGTREYAEPVIDALERDVPSFSFGRRFYRDSCSIDAVKGAVIKDLRILGEPDLEKVVIVDNTPGVFALQPACGVAVQSFYGDPYDRALVDHVLPALRARLASAQKLYG